MAEKATPRGTLPEVELGFVESPEDPATLTSPFYPSKVGGRPAWLDQENLPSPSQLSCDNCGKPAVFLLQVYAPIRDGQHRALFLFMCLDPQCHQKDRRCFKVLRCELHTDGENSSSSDTLTGTDNNDGIDKLCYPLKSVQLQEDHNQASFACESTDTTIRTKAQNEQLLDKSTPLCIVCGCGGPKFCGKCKKVNYCSREHQLHDWKSGHKSICSELAEGKYSLLDLTYDPAHGVVLPELEIVTEVEPDPNSVTKGQDRSEDERMMDYLKFVEKTGGTGSQQFDVKKLEEAALSEHKTDKQFRVFKKRVALEPEQVIRYQRGGQPLLVANDGAPSTSDVPRCSCGAERQFEFQVMPQLLYYLKLEDTMSSNSIDWGTLIVYTCTDSCTMKSTGGGNYHVEFLWKQDFSN